MSSPLPRQSLAKRVASGTYWSAIASGSQQLITLMIFAVLARKLTPVEFGVVAIASIFLDLLTLVGRVGLTEAIVQRSRLSKHVEATAFWLSACIGALCSAALMFSAHAISRYFHDSSLVLVVQWLAPVVLLNALGTVPEGLLKRDFAFKALAVRTIIATVTGGIVAIALATWNYGALSLVAQRLVMAALLLVTVWHSARWIPRFNFSTGEAKRLLHVGTALATSTLLAVGNQRVLDGVIGRLLGATPLGFMRIAWRAFDAITSIVFMPILQIGLPLFSKLQHDKARLAEAYIRLSGLTSLVVFPAFIGSILIAPEFIHIAFGPQWDASIVLMQILSLSALTMPLIWFKSSALIALGKSNLVLRLNILEFILSFAIVAISCRWGLIGVAWGNVARVFLVSVPILWSLQNHAGISALKLLRSNIPALVSVGLMLLLGYSLLRFAPLPAEPLLKIATIVPICAAVYVLTLIFLFRSSIQSAAAYLPTPLGRLLSFSR